MPKRTAPIFCRDEVVEAPAHIAEKAETTLLELLGVDRTISPAITLELLSFATRYARWRAQEAGRPPRRQSSAALRVLKAAATRLGATGRAADRSIVRSMLWGLCAHAELPFRLALDKLHRQAGLDGDAAFLLDDAVLDWPDLIAAAAQDALDQLNAQTGPDRDDTLRVIMQHLVSLWQKTTGRRATYSRASGDEYSHSATSPAGLFVTAFFKAMEPKLAASAPAEALRDVNAHRR